MLHQPFATLLRLVLSLAVRKPLSLLAHLVAKVPEPVPEFLWQYPGMLRQCLSNWSQVYHFEGGVTYHQTATLSSQLHGVEQARDKLLHFRIVLLPVQTAAHSKHPKQ